MNARLVLYGLLFLLLALSWGASCVIYQAAQTGELIAPLDRRHFEAPTIVAVGTGNDRENPERLGPSTAVASGETILLVDAGRGIAEALRKAAIPPSQPETVLLTSLLPESSVGLDDLWLTGWREGRVGPLQVIGPPGTTALVDGLVRGRAASLEATGRALGLPMAGAGLLAAEAGSGWREDRGDLSLQAQPLPTGPGGLGALAWRIESRGSQRRVVVLTGTGWDDEALVEAARDADVWVHEAAYVPTPEDAEEAGVIVDPEVLERDAALHTGLEEVAALAQRARVGKLVLTRLRPPPMFEFQVTGPLSRDFEGEIVVPRDGDEVEP